MSDTKNSITELPENCDTTLPRLNEHSGNIYENAALMATDFSDRNQSFIASTTTEKISLSLIFTVQRNN